MKQTKIKKIVKESKILNIHKSHYLLIPKTICDAIEVKPYQKFKLVLDTVSGSILIESMVGTK
jgi:hypothetical protein